MKIPKTLILLPTLTVLAALPQFGQEGSDAARDAQLEPSEATQPRPVFLRASIGPEALVDDGAGQVLGTVRDHVVDRASGKVLFVVVLPQGDVGPGRLVPYDHFRWDDETHRLELPLPAAELRALGEYQPEKLGLAEATPAPHSDEPPTTRARPLHLASSQALRSQVAARSDPFGAVEGLLLEPRQGTLAFVLAGSSASQADPYLIPWQALTFERVPETGTRFVLGLAADGLAGAPRLMGGDTASLGNRETLARIHRFYKVSLPPL